MEPSKAKILLVEDDASMGFLLVDFLESNGFVVELFKDGYSGLQAFNSVSFDFCILDVMLPGIDGFSIAEKIRKINKQIPIILLTARNMKVDKIKGFHLGVDDYITKPFDEDELLCRIKAILNRVNSADPARNRALVYQIKSYSFDFRNQLLIREDQSVRLTKKESEVMKKLCDSVNHIVTRDDILLSVWGDNNYFNGRSLDVFITKLRKYLQDDPEVTIENIPKVGFVLNA